jgi:3-methyl-2-oxobutanoate hydroxymethyltransferase
MSQAKWTAERIRKQKGKSRFAVLTAYDYTTARLVDRADIPVIIVGDSLGMTMLGYDSTIPVTMEDMVHHTRAVARGAGRALVVADMPFLSYQVSDEEAVRNAGRLLKDAAADAVKIEGGSFRTHTVQQLIANGIPVMGHIGLTPQSVRAFGGYRVQGRTEEAAQNLKEDAIALTEAGVFSLVLEGMPSALATEITNSISIPTIGIGAGPGCDAHVLVVHDLLGLFDEFTPKFVKRYAHLAPVIADAFTQYRQEVEQGLYPGPEHEYGPT